MPVSFFPFHLGPAIAPSPTRPDVEPTRPVMPPRRETEPDTVPDRSEPALPFVAPSTDPPSLPQHEPDREHQTCFGRSWTA